LRGVRDVLDARLSRHTDRVFTGIVRERARVLSFEDGRLVVESSLKPAVGDSISIDGTCLTVVDSSDGRLAFDVMAETAARAKPYRAEVNLEPAVEAGQPLGGHYVQGHVDGVGLVRAFESERMTIEAPSELLRYCVEKGSIAVDGVSLTIAGLRDDAFEVALVPHTLEVTTLGSLKPGDPVNLEVDVLAKYVEKLIHPDTI
jgi:riboflavin synthase